MKHKMCGEINYPGKGVITDEDVYNEVVKHSRLIDRLSNRKMVEMTLYAQNVLMGLFEDEGITSDGKWHFYGRNGLFKDGYFQF